MIKAVNSYFGYAYPNESFLEISLFGGTLIKSLAPRTSDKDFR